MKKPKTLFEKEMARPGFRKKFERERKAFVRELRTKARRKKKIIYVCGIDFQHELGPDGGCDPIKVYNSVADLKRHSKCWKECGIVAVELIERGWIREQRLPSGRARARKAGNLETLLKESRMAARNAGLKPSDIAKTVKKVRRGQAG